ncbi:MAG: hypothetical protein Nk1A_8440 [Endomicrobiia bacterium]|nr:MAG: hypothetical protein Nk1A_8440 [Endomicrobiia bacterium]
MKIDLNSEVLLLKYGVTAKVTEIRGDAVIVKTPEAQFEFLSKQINLDLDGTYYTFVTAENLKDFSDVYKKLLSVEDKVYFSDFSSTAMNVPVIGIEGSKVFVGKLPIKGGGYDWYYNLEDFYYDPYLGYVVNSEQAQLNKFFPNCNLYSLENGEVEASLYDPDMYVCKCTISDHRDGIYISDFIINESLTHAKVLLDYITKKSTKSVIAYENTILTQKFLKSCNFKHKSSRYSAFIFEK